METETDRLARKTAELRQLDLLFGRVDRDRLGSGEHLPRLVEHLDTEAADGVHKEMSAGELHRSRRQLARALHRGKTIPA